MATTTVSFAGKGPATKRTLYVGGLEDSVDEGLLEAAFVPFGDIKSVMMPTDYKTGKKKGFGFVEFEEKEDAFDALDNMNQAEICGRTITVDYAQPPKAGGGLDKSKAVWANDTDAYMQRLEEDAARETAGDAG